MGSPGRSRSYADRELERSPDKKKGMDVDDDESISNERRKQKLSKSRKSSNEEETDGWDDSGRKKSHSDRNENRRRSGGSSRGDIEEDDYDRRKESGLKQVKRKQGENALEELSNRYQDGELEHKHDVSDKTKTGSHSRIAENDKYSSRKTTSKFSDQEGPQSKSKNEKEKSNDTHHEKETHKDSRYLDRGEGSREKGHGSSEQAKNQRRRDESDAARKSGESYYGGKLDPRRGKESDSRHENSRERSVSAVPENNEGKERLVDATSDKGKSYDREERRADIRSKSGGRSGSKEEDDKVSPQNRGDNSGRDKHEKLREQRSTGHDVVGDRDRLPDPEHDDNARKREDDGRGVHSRRSKTPERSGRHFRENSDVNYERSGSLKRKELEKEGTQDDRAKGRDDSWIDRNRDVEGSRESWKRKQPSSNDRDGDSAHDRDREWEVPRRGRDRIDSERPSGRSGNRKDARSEAVKASSNFGISTENYDVIEIQTKALDPGSAFSGRNEAQQHDSNPSREEWSVPQDDLPMTDAGGPAPPGDDSKGKHLNESTSTYDQNPWRDDTDSQGGKARVPLAGVPSRPSSSQISGDGSQSPYSNHEPGSFGRLSQQGVRGNRIGRGGRVRPPGRDNQPVNVPLPLMGLPFEPLGLPPPGPMQPLNPTMSPAPGLQVPHAAFAPPFSRPLMWPGAGGVDMNMLPVPPSVPPLPPGPAGQRFPPNLGTPSNPAMYFNQPGPGRGVPPMESSPGYNSIIPVGRGPLHDKGSGNWVPPRSSGPPGKAPSRGEQNDYSQNFVDTGMRPQNFIRELELTNVEDYPKLRELIQKKDEIVANSATTPMYYKCDLREFVLSPESFGTKFDVILVDPPWEEYVHRAPGVTDHMDYWTFEEIMNLKIEAIADTPSFIFLWVGDAVGLEQGRQCLKKWGFRRCEDICWVKTNKHTATPALRHDSHTLLQHSKEHCLMGIKGTVRRSTDGHIIHANIDTDVIIAEEPPYGSTAKPDEMYRIIEHFALGRRRIELFGEDHNIRSGWLTVGKGLSSSNFNSEAYVRNFSDKDGKVWQGGGGRNPPPDTPHLVQTTPDIESLRPKSPMKNQQQLQQQSNSISLTTANSSNRRPTVNSPQNPSPFGLNQEASSSNHPPPWASPMVGGAFKGRDLANVGSGENFFDVYGYNMPPPMQTSGEYLEFESQRAMNML